MALIGSKSSRFHLSQGDGEELVLQHCDIVKMYKVCFQSSNNITKLPFSPYRIINRNQFYIC